LHGAVLTIVFVLGAAAAIADPAKKVLIVVEGSSDLKNYAMGDGRQLGALLGHFNTSTTIHGSDKYQHNELNDYDYTFYIGFHAVNQPPAMLVDDIMNTEKPVIWLNTGFREFSSERNVKKKFGFSVSQLDTGSQFDVVRSKGKMFQKGEPNLNLIEIVKNAQVTVLATAVSTKTKKERPYIIQSRNLTYVADSPFASAGDSDRYLLFADLLHDLMNENHPESHSALIRIEDVTPLENPEKLRDIADILSGRGIPFLVGVVPFYVNPEQGIRVSLSEKPEIVDALKYMVQNGGTIVMHGVTHQYKGVTADDYEFWDGSTNKPVKDQTQEAITRKLEQGLQEFFKNGLYPLVWETPHYTASFLLYQTVAKYFGSAMEQRLSIEDFDYSQFFPYLIEKDLFGQKIYPENLGYIPLEEDGNAAETAVTSLINNARTNLYVRDGFASCFFHAFVDLDLLKNLVDGIHGLGYTYLDLKDEANWVKTKDRIALSGSQEYSLTLEDQYLLESYYSRNGELLKKISSETRLKGLITRTVALEPGEFYKAEAVEFHERQPSLAENVTREAKKLYASAFPTEETWQEARPAILWNHYAKGAAYNDQASFAAVFRSVNIHVDTIFVGQPISLTPYNLLIVPYIFVDSLQQAEYDLIGRFIEDGGHVITDAKNFLAQDFGISFTSTYLKVSRVRDQYFPEEKITWRYSELLPKFEAEDIEEVFCTDDATEAPLVIGKKVGKGKLIFFGTRFDPYTQLGYSMYPYLLEYVRRYFKLGPVVRRENLEMYFEPGDRRTTSIEHLVRQWVSLGIHVVHVSGWHQYPKYNYDYKRLIDLAHANGILVYAWLEPPQVSQMFWKNHPEWREKNYKGEDVTPSWRYPVALTDRQCVDTMAVLYKAFLDQYDWDGVNLAELYFEAGKGFDNPNLFTPMHPSAQKEVRKKYGIDLKSIFDSRSPFYWKTNPAVKPAIVEYRVGVIKDVYERLLAIFREIALRKPGFQVIVTALDSYGSPELREFIGVDMDRLVDLQKRFGFLLQVEDPESRWSTSPLRYLSIGKQYVDRVGDKGKILLDLNILSFRKPDVVTPFPTLIPTGTESFELVNTASLGAPRITIYSEASTNPQDLRFLSHALASEVMYRPEGSGYVVESPYSFVLTLPSETGSISVDGMPLSPVRENLFLIPAGKHALRTNVDQGASFSAYSLQTRILSCTANILSCTYEVRSVLFDYQSDTRTMVSINREPSGVTVDGRPYAFTALKGNDCYSIMLPAGLHNVRIVGGDPFSYGVNLTSLWSSTAIAIFGALAVLLLILLYLVIRALRLRTVR
jgi:uncharacterized protein YdaL